MRINFNEPRYMVMWLRYQSHVWDQIKQQDGILAAKLRNKLYKIFGNMETNLRADIQIF
jgi:hypothetical protein